MSKQAAPLALDPGVVRALQPTGPNAKADPALTTLEGAFAAAHGSLDAVARLHGALADDPTLTPAAKGVRLGQAALKAGEAVAQRLDDGDRRLREVIATTEAETLPSPPADPGLASEIRGALRTMKRADRQKVIADAVAAGDAATIGAALTGPAMLVGMSADERKMLATDWRRHHAPEALDRLDRLAKAAEAVSRAGKASLGFVGPLRSIPLPCWPRGRRRQPRKL
jgi:hypothetical protein